MIRRVRAFTLLELIIAIAVIALLVGILAVSLRRVMASSRQTRSLSALRQMAMGYTGYTHDHRGMLMPGYIGADLFAPGQPFAALDVTLPDGTVLDELDSQSYVWRLAPYVDHAWELFYADAPEPDALAELEAQFADGDYGPAGVPLDPDSGERFFGGIAERPTFGLNSLFVGGDSVHAGGGSSVSWNPSPALTAQAATRLSEVRNPAVVILFGAAALSDEEIGGTTYLEPSAGFAELRPPWLIPPADADGAWVEPQWQPGTAGIVETVSASDFTVPPGGGVPAARHGRDTLPLAHLDGSTSLDQLDDLDGRFPGDATVGFQEMRRWYPFSF